MTLRKPPYALDNTIGLVKSFINGVWGIPIYPSTLYWFENYWFTLWDQALQISNYFTDPAKSLACIIIVESNEASYLPSIFPLFKTSLKLFNIGKCSFISVNKIFSITLFLNAINSYLSIWHKKLFLSFFKISKVRETWKF